jgi:hypothetical protein
MTIKRMQVMAEFADQDAMLRALELLRQNRYHALEAFSPYPVSEVPERLRLSRPWLPLLAFAGGLMGALLGYGIQWYADAYDYPLNVGGRPMHSALAFIPSTFEAAVLGAALTAFIALLIVMGLPALWQPVFEVDQFERASVDRFWVRIEGVRDAIAVRKIRRLLAELGALRVVPMETEP